MNLEILKNILQLDNDISPSIIANSIIIYLRKSRRDSDYFKDESVLRTLERHEKQLQEWAVKVLGRNIPDNNIFREIASGDTIEDRPVMQKVLNIIENDNIKAVLCIEIERLARGNTIDQGIIAQAFKYSNTKIITPYKVYNLDNEDDLVYFEDGLYQSRKYLLYTKRILKRGRIRSVQDGKYIASISPYGYKKKKLINEKGYTLEYEENEVKIINLIANLYAYGIDSTYTIKEDDTVFKIARIYGMTKDMLLALNPNSSFRKNDVIIIKNKMGFSAIANYLNSLNISPRKASKWTVSIIRNILTSPTLYGYVSWGARETVTTMKHGKIIKTRPRNKNCLYAKGNFKPILNLDDVRTKIIIDKIKNRNKSNKNNNYRIKSPLSGLVRCSSCDKVMVRRPSNNKYRKDTLYCRSIGCKTVGSDMDLVLDYLLNYLSIGLKKYNNFLDNYKLDNNFNNTSDLISVIDNELEKNNYKLMRCYDFLEDGTYTKDIFNKRISAIQLNILNLKKKKNDIINTKIKNKDNIMKIPKLFKIKDFYNSCDNVSLKNELLSSIIKKVIYTKNKGGRGYEDSFKLKIYLNI